MTTQLKNTAMKIFTDETVAAMYHRQKQSFGDPPLQWRHSRGRGAQLRLLGRVSQLFHSIVSTSNFGELARDDLASRPG